MRTTSKILLACLLGSGYIGIAKAQSPAGPSEAVRQRVAAKVERVYEGVRKWAESGRDPSVIGKTMEEKVKPLLETGKFMEAEAELDRVLDQLKQDGKGTESPTNPVEAAHQRVSAKVEFVTLDVQEWVASGRDPSAIGRMMEENVKPLLEAGKFIEADKELDRVLEQLEPHRKSTESPTNPAEAMQRRVAAKIERVEEGARKWLASGRDPSDIGRMMEENVKPLLDAGKFIEADKELDRVLEQLEPDGKSMESPSAPAQAVRQQVPEEARQQMRHKLDSSFVVFRDKVQEELKLTKEQEAKLEEVLPDAMQFFQKIKDLQPEEQERELKIYRPKAREKLAAVLQETLNEGQLTRLRQIELQRDQLFGGEIWKELQVTDEQRKQFMALIQETQKKIKTLMEEIQTGANPYEIRPKVLKNRADLEGQLEALLTDAQKNQWKEMLGKPMDLDDIFDK